MKPEPTPVEAAVIALIGDRNVRHTDDVLLAVLPGYGPLQPGWEARADAVIALTWSDFDGWTHLGDHYDVGPCAPLRVLWREDRDSVQALLRARWRDMGFYAPVSRGDAGRIVVWAFRDAPDWLRMIADQGGDEDWIVYVADDAAFTTYGLPTWVEAMDAGRDPERIDMGEGAALYVATH